MYFRQLLNDDRACASYLMGCKSKAQLAVVDTHADLMAIPAAERAAAHSK